MSALMIFCPRHLRNERLTPTEAHDLIHALAAQWADEATDPTGVHAGEPGWQLAAQFCPTGDLAQLRDVECYGEHIEGMHESRKAFR